MDLDLIEFYELRKPHEHVDELLRQNPNLPFPLPIDDIASAFGIIDIQYKDMPNMEGALVADVEKTKGIILVNSGIENDGRRRFTIGHELGHFMLLGHGHEQSCSKDDMSIKSKEPIEKEANEFASELLIPTRVLRESEYFRAEPNIENIQKLAGRFDVSLQACGNKYTRINDYPIATVVSRDSRVRYCRRNFDEVPFWLNYRKGDLISNISVTSRSSNEKEGTITCELVDSSIWFNEQKGFVLPEQVLEQVLVQGDGYRYTLLWFEDEILETE